MFELTMNGRVVRFNFGVGFLRVINKTFKQKGSNGVEKDAGLQMKFAGLLDGDVLDLIDVLDAGNRFAGEPRVTVAEIEGFIDRCEDIDGLFEDVKDALKESNACRKAVSGIQRAWETEMAKRSMS